MINRPYFLYWNIIKINSNQSPPKSVTNAYGFGTFLKTPYRTHHWCIQQWLYDQQTIFLYWNIIKTTMTNHLRIVSPMCMDLGHFWIPPIGHTIDDPQTIFLYWNIIKINSNQSPPKSVTNAYEFGTFLKTPYRTHHWCIQQWLYDQQTIIF